MPIPNRGTPEFDALVAETGGGALLPGFDYEAHIAATSGEHEITTVQIPIENIQIPPEQAEIIPFGDNQSQNSGGSNPLVNPGMPARGTVEFNQLAIETGGGSLLPGFNYQGHINAVGGSNDPVLGMELYDFIPPPKMPDIGSEDWIRLSEETGGGSELEGFNYEAHLYATRGSDATELLMQNGDSIQGRNHDDVIYGYGGNDFIDGGQGIDTAGFTGNIREYSFSFDSDDGGKLIISDLIESRNGSDKVTGIELIQFGNDIFDTEEIRILAVNNLGSRSIPQVKRLFNQDTGKHLFSSDQTEVDYLTGGSLGWVNEGDAYNNSNNGNQSVYRFSINGSHFYTANEDERNLLTSSSEFSNFIFEGEAHKAFSADSTPGVVTGLIPVRRYYNYQSNSHLFSSSLEEQAVLGGNPFFVDEGIAWYSEPVS